MISVVLHILNEDPIVGEIDDLPMATDSLLIIKNPRRRDGKDIHYIDANVKTVIWPISKISFIEVMPVEEEEDIITFIRE